MRYYVLDACALIAFLRNEDGAEIVSTILNDAVENEVKIHMSYINLLEVYYDIYRSAGQEKAKYELDMIKMLPVTFQTAITDEVFAKAGRFKATYRISLADSIALAEASVSGSELLTADHHEFDVIEKQESVSFCWIR